MENPMMEEIPEDVMNLIESAPELYKVAHDALLTIHDTIRREDLSDGGMEGLQVTADELKSVLKMARGEQ